MGVALSAIVSPLCGVDSLGPPIRQIPHAATVCPAGVRWIRSEQIALRAALSVESACRDHPPRSPTVHTHSGDTIATSTPIVYPHSMPRTALAKPSLQDQGDEDKS